MNGDAFVSERVSLSWLSSCDELNGEIDWISCSVEGLFISSRLILAFSVLLFLRFCTLISLVIGLSNELTLILIIIISIA